MKRSSAQWLTVFICFVSVSAHAGLTNTERKSQFEKALGLIIATATPQVPSNQRELLIRDYEKAKPNRGQAVLLGEGRFFRSTEHETLSVTGDRTLEACQLRYAKPCALIAVNEEIVSDGELVSKDMPRLHYAGDFDLAQIPIIRLATRLRNDIQSYYGAAGPKAIAIHPWGLLFVSTNDLNSKVSQEAALAKCNADPRRSNQDGPCFVYAIDNKVVLPERRTVPQ